MGKGYEINWQMPTATILQNPQYLQYQNVSLDSIDPGIVKNALSGLKPNAENAEVIAYLSWVIRTIALMS